MPILDVIKTNFQMLSKAFENGDIALLKCRNSTNGEPAYAICAINGPFGLMLDHDPNEILIPPTVLEFNRPVQPQVNQKYTGPKKLSADSKAIGTKVPLSLSDNP
jgi:hypothetical protein